MEIKRISSKHTDKKKQRRTQFIIGGILIFIMIFSVIAGGIQYFGQEEDSNKVEYNGYDFVGMNSYWVVTLGNFQFAIRNNPNELQKTLGVVKGFNLYQSQPLYISSSDDYTSQIISMNFGQIASRMQNACFGDCEEDYPVKDCNNNLIVIREAEFNKIEQNESCVFIEGKSEDLEKLVDEFILKTIGIN